MLNRAFAPFEDEGGAAAGSGAVSPSRALSKARSMSGLRRPASPPGPGHVWADAGTPTKYPGSGFEGEGGGDAVDAAITRAEWRRRP